MGKNGFPFGWLKKKEAPKAPETPPRLLALSKERQLAFTTAYKLRKESDRRRGMSRFEYEQEDIAWKEFALTFLETPEDISLVQYAQKPETFPADRFKVATLVSMSIHSYDPNRKYGSRGTTVTEPISERSIYIDAPVGFSLLYKKDDGSWEPISTVTFVPDFRQHVILVDQLQGGDTARDRASDEARRVRMKFAKKPEEILYEIVRGLGVKTGMRGMGIRKPQKNDWQKVRAAAQEGRQTTYSQVASSQELRGFASEDYYLEPLEAPIEPEVEN